jgi:PPM family protein phosphatase
MKAHETKSQSASRREGLRLEGAMLSEVGNVRFRNEDTVLFVTPADRSVQQDCLALIADGMGGHVAGEVASSMAAEIVRRVFFELQGPVPKILTSAFSEANAAIIAYGRDHPEYAGMGTTCTALVVRENKAWLAHVGDSRAYLLRGSTITQLSQDQTLVAKLVRDGTITKEQAKTSEYNNVVLQALGTSQELQPEIWKEGKSLASGDILILCSDGLHGLVPDPTIADTASRLAPLEACHELVRSALDAGGHDNISVGVFRVITGEETGVHSKDTTRRIKPPPDIFEEVGKGAASVTRRVRPFDS